jgi:hypothetical protein
MSTKPKTQTPTELADLDVLETNAADVRGGAIVMEFARPTRPAEPPDTMRPAEPPDTLV